MTLFHFLTPRVIITDRSIFGGFVVLPVLVDALLSLVSQ